MFDSYTLKARYYPVVILFLPIVLMGIAYSFEFLTVVHFLSSVGIAGALTYLFSQLGRDRGKEKEADLWKNWGGPPTTQLFRLNNSRIDPHTKNRYHAKMRTLCPTLIIPDIILETTEPATVDEVYRAWTKFLLSKTRDTKTYTLLFRENTSYGFRRNLWGLKRTAITIIILSLVANYIYWIISLNTFNPINFPKGFMYTTIVLTGLLLFWIFIVNRVWIKPVAFSYGERLIEAIDMI